MVRHSLSVCSYPWRKGYGFILASCWFFGLLCGILCYIATEPYFLSVMHRAAYGTMSIVGALCSAILPFLLSIIGLCFSNPLLLGFCFLRALLYGFFSVAVLQLFASASWLFHCLVMFRSCVTLPVLYFFWLRNLSGKNPYFDVQSLLVMSYGVLMGSLDYRIISSVLAGLLSY